MARLLGLARKFWAGEDAATCAEYVLMAMLVAVACVVALTAFGQSIGDLYLAVVEGLR